MKREETQWAVVNDDKIIATFKHEDDAMATGLDVVECVLVNVTEAVRAERRLLNLKDTPDDGEGDGK